MAETWSTEQILALIDEEERKYPNIPRGLSKAVATQESYLNPNATGDNGRSLGLFQLQPAAAKDAGIDPAKRHIVPLNVQGGVRYISQKIAQSKGNVDEALSRYNRGTPDYRGIGDPNYVQNVRRFYNPDGGEPPRAQMAQTTPTERPWWQKALGAIGPRSAEAADLPRQPPATKKWWEDLPPEEPNAQAQTPPPPPTQAPAPGQKWWETLPPEAPPEPPGGTQRPVPSAEEPPGAGVAPAPSQRAPQPPTARSTPEDDAAYRRSVGQEEPPSDVTIDIEKESPPSPESSPEPPLGPYESRMDPSKPEGQKTMSELLAEHEAGLRTNDDRSWLRRAYDATLAPAFATQPTQPGTKEGVLASVDRLQAQQPGGMFGDYDPSRTGTVARELAATGIETAAGIAGGTAGAYLGGGPAGVYAGGTLGQSYGRRLTNQLGLRQPEEPIASAGYGLTLYPSDVLNAGFGLLTAGWPMAKQLLGTSMAGKAIIAAEAETKTAFDAWQAAEKAATAAQQKGQAKAWETAMGKARIKRMEYEGKVKARGDTIAANQAEYDAAEQQWKAQGRTQILREEGDQKLWEQRAADARTREYGSARADLERTQGTYQADVAAREQQIRTQAAEDAATARRTQTRAASEQDLYQRDVEAIRQADALKAQEAEAASQAKYAGTRAEIARAQQGQQAAQQEARQIPYSVKTGDKPAWQLYDDWRQSAQDVDVPLAQGKADLAALRSARDKTISGEPTPFAPEVERVVADIEAAGATGRVTSVYEGVKKLGKLARSSNAAIRREAAQVGEVLGDILEQSPAANAQLGAARLAWRREAAQDTMQGWFKQKGILSTKGGKEVINADALFDKFKRELEKPLFAKSFTPQESQALYEQFQALAENTPLMPSVKATRQPPPPPVTPPAPSAIPKPPPPRGLTAPTPPPADVPIPQVDTLPGAMAEAPPGVGPRPQTKALPERPTPKAIPPEVSPPTATHVPYVERAEAVPQPAPVAPTLGARPRVIKPLMGAGSVGALAYTLSRMGVSSTAVDTMLYTGAGLIAANVARKQADYFIAKAFLNPRLRPLLQAAMENNTLNPRFYAAMLAVMNNEERRDMPRELQRLRVGQQKARR